MPSEEDRATATGIMHKKILGEVRLRGFELCERTDRQTDRRADYCMGEVK